MNFFQLLGLGYKNYVKGISFLITHKLYWYILFPLVLFAGVYWMGTYFRRLEYGIGQELEDNLTTITELNGVTWYSLRMLLLDSLYVIFTKFTLYIVVVMLSPILALLSERIEQIIAGNKYKFSLKQLFNDIKRGLRIALRNIFWEYFFIVIVLGLASLFDGTVRNVLIFSIPVAIGFYFYGFAFLDYINERRRLNIQQSIYFVSKHRGLAIAIGSIYSIFFLSFFYVFRGFEKLPPDTTTQLIWGSILVITFFLAAIAPILAITSATLSMHELVDLSKNEFAIRGKNDALPPEKSPQEKEETIENSNENSDLAGDL